MLEFFMGKKKPYGVTFFGVAFSGFFINASTAGLFSILPLYARDVTGLSEVLVAQLDAFSELFSYGSRIFVGGAVDVARARKPFLVFAVAAIVLAQSGFLFVTSVMGIAVFRCMQRMSSGLVAIPRDVMVGAVLEPHQRARGYSLQRIFKTVGSVIGSGMVFPFLVVAVHQEGFQRCVVVCVIFAVMALICVIFLVNEPRHVKAKAVKGKLFFGLVRRLPKEYWRVLCVAVFYHLGHFSETFLIFRLVDHGIAQVYVPLCQIAWCLGGAATVYPIGVLADKYGVRNLIMVVFGIMVLGNICLATPNVFFLFLGMWLWGAQTYATQSLLAAEINCDIHENLRGTAFGILYLACGLSLVVASFWAGFVWKAFGYSVMFSVGAAVGAVSIFLVQIFFPQHRRPKVEEV